MLRYIDDADAADALRAQVAALQAENERLRAERDGLKSVYELCVLEREDALRNAMNARSELAAAQANLAVPVPEDVEDLIAWLHAKWRRHGEIEDRNARDALAALARDNAALRTKLAVHDQLVMVNDCLAHQFQELTSEHAALRTTAKALERERDAYKGMFELVERIPMMTDAQLEQLRQNALAAKALAEKS